MPRGKHAREERFDILVTSGTDARKKPLLFSFSKNKFFGLIAAIILAIAIFISTFVFFIVQNAQSYEKINHLEKDQKDQKNQIDSLNKELQTMRIQSENNKTQVAMASVPPAADIQPQALQASQPVQTAQTEREQVKPATTIKGKRGEKINLQQKTASGNVADLTAQWTSSNEDVAKVTKKGEVILTGPGTATITALSDADNKTVYKVTCESKLESAHYCQSDSRWGFSDDVGDHACMVTAFAILLENANIKATPRTVYNTSRSLSLNYSRLCDKFGVKMVNALSKKSPYLESFNGEVTYIKNPEKNYVAAVKEALGRNPEGVCLYFKRGSEAHMIVAIGYKGDTIYYSDPGRVESKGNIVDFSQTWVYHEHKMTYKNIAYMAALDVK